MLALTVGMTGRVMSEEHMMSPAKKTSCETCWKHNLLHELLVHVLLLKTSKPAEGNLFCLYLGWRIPLRLSFNVAHFTLTLPLLMCELLRLFNQSVRCWNGKHKSARILKVPVHGRLWWVHQTPTSDAHSGKIPLDTHLLHTEKKADDDNVDDDDGSAEKNG